VAKIVEFADAVPSRRGGPGRNEWPALAAELRASGRRAARLDRKGGVNKLARKLAEAAGLRVVGRKVNGEPQTWIELLDTPAPAGPPPSTPTPPPSAPAAKATTVTVPEFVETWRAAKGNAAGVRQRLGLTPAEFTVLRDAARKDGLI